MGFCVGQNTHLQKGREKEQRHIPSQKVHLECEHGSESSLPAQGMERTKGKTKKSGKEKEKKKRKSQKKFHITEKAKKIILALAGEVYKDIGK